jgi:hypothetical protein
VVSEGALVPEGHLAVGLAGRGGFASLVRFEANDEDRRIGLSELMRIALGVSGARVAAVVAVAETAGLVGAALRRSPAVAAGEGEERFAFPGIRDWLSFTGERAHRESASLVAGVVAEAGSAYDPWLRPLAPGSGLVGHLHAAVFGYRPLRKGRIDLVPSVAGLFDGQPLLGVLHLICDPRGFSGAGESEFYRGAVWVAPVRT